MPRTPEAHIREVQEFSTLNMGDAEGHWTLSLSGGAGILEEVAYLHKHILAAGLHEHLQWLRAGGQTPCLKAPTWEVADIARHRGLSPRDTKPPV